MEEHDKKAKELIEKYKEPILVSPEEDVCVTFAILGNKQAKQCAIIAVDEILKEGATQYGVTAVEYGREDFWEKVKESINNL